MATAPSPLNPNPAAVLKPPPPPVPAPAYTGATSPGVSLTPTNPSNDLRGQTISVGPTANREQIANTYEQNWDNATNPQFQSDLKSATSQAAGAGQLGSGQLRTSLGDLAYNRDVQRNAQESNFLNTALNGTIGDAYQNVGIAQQQQQAQQAAQNQTFNQGLQSLAYGGSGNPSATQLGVSGIYGQQAQGGQQAVSGAIQNANNTAYQQQILNMIGGGKPATTTTTTPTGTPLYNDGYSYGGVTG